MSFVIFQFHKGAIETEREEAITEAVGHFQFHKGAIETPIDGKEAV